MSTEAVNNEKELLSKVSDGDAHAFSLFFHAYNARLFPFVLKLIRSTAIAEEIVQEVFLRAWINREKLPNLDQPAAWLFRIASNLALTHLRDRANEVVKHTGFSQHQVVPVNEIADWLEKKEMVHLVEQAIHLLPPKRQAVFRLHRQGGITYRQIADQLDISPNTVKEHIAHAMKFIRTYIHQQSGIVPGVLVLVYLSVSLP